MTIRTVHTLSAVAVLGLACAGGALANDGKMQMMDTNKDGAISSAEHSAGARNKFQKMDVDGDGRITAGEMDASHMSQMSGDQGRPTMSSADKIKAIDTDNDGVLTAAEHEAGSREMFGKLDADGDGNLTLAEMEAGHQKMMGEKPR